jgi:hypothetical protein
VPAAKNDDESSSSAENRHTRTAHHSSHRHAHVRRHHQARTQTAHVQAGPAQQIAPQAPAQQANPLQTAFQSLFSGSGTAAQSQAPVASFSGGS